MVDGIYLSIDDTAQYPCISVRCGSLPNAAFIAAFSSYVQYTVL